MRRTLRRFGVDRAVAFGVASRVFSVLAGPVTLLIIAARLSRVEQGYYYTFASLLAIQSFLELGLGTVIVQFASHEWSELSVDEQGRVNGSARSSSRLASLLRFSIRWYVMASIAAVLGLGLAGHFFFARSEAGGPAWVWPWLALCVTSGAALALLPLWSILEGCNRVGSVYLFRLWYSIVTTLAIWGALVSGAGLWTAPLAAATGVVFSAAVLLRLYRGFFRSLLSQRVEEGIDWRTEILPLQWRIAVSWISGYFVFQIFTPMSFRMLGPEVAAQVGMSWAVVTAVAATAYTWVATKIPRMGILVAQGAYTELDRLFFRASALSLAAFVVASAMGLAATAWLYASGHPLASRILPVLPFALFLAGSLIATATWNLSAYARAHKQEPFVGISVLGGAITAFAAFLLGRRFGVTGMAAGYFGAWCVQCALFAARFVRLRAAWHHQSHELSSDVLGASGTLLEIGCE